MSQAFPAGIGACFPLIQGTKLPAVSAWRVVTPGAYQPVGSYGVALAASALVIDADPRNYPPNRDVLVELLTAYPALRLTFAVKTPRGGYHLYVTKPAGLKIKKHQAAYPGIDFISEGGFVCGPGTRTSAGKDTAEGVYTPVNNNPIAAAPEALLASLEAPAQADTASLDDVTYLYAGQFQTMCEVEPPAVAGQHGDQTTYTLACKGRDLGLPKEETYRIMRDHFNPRCQPQWNDSELWLKVEHAYTYAKNGLGSATPEAKLKDFTPPPPAQGVKVADTSPLSIKAHKENALAKSLVPSQFDYDREQKLKPTIANVLLTLLTDPHWQGLFRYNAFVQDIEYNGDRPFWRRELATTGADVRKEDFQFIQAWFSAARRVEIPENVLKAALYTAAIQDSHHPVKDEILSEPWDGIPRLDRMMIDTLGCDDNPYNREVSRVFGLSAVKRIFEPGCKQDYVPVIEGDQGIGKSLWLATFGGKHSSTGQLRQHDKDSYQNLRGKWIVELPEINSTFSKQDFAWLKGVISTSIDVYRPSYGHRSVEVPRDSIFAGTINPDATGAYLNDDENRRYLPIFAKAVNIERLKQDRKQLLAEAYHRYSQGEQIFIHDKVLLAQARAEQAKRQVDDTWADVLNGYLIARDEITPSELYSVLKLTPKDLNGAVKRKLARSMRALGFSFVRDSFASGAYKRASQPAIKLEDLF
jgi:predicted P-loop ATPase